MAKVITKQSMQNMEYVRELLKKKQPEFAAALELAVRLVEHGLQGRQNAGPGLRTTNQRTTDDASANLRACVPLVRDKPNDKSSRAQTARRSEWSTASPCRQSADAPSCAKGHREQADGAGGLSCAISSTSAGIARAVRGRPRALCGPNIRMSP